MTYEQIEKANKLRAIRWGRMTTREDKFVKKMYILSVDIESPDITENQDAWMDKLLVKYKADMAAVALCRRHPTEIHRLAKEGKKWTYGSNVCCGAIVSINPDSMTWFCPACAKTGPIQFLHPVRRKK